MAGTSIFDYGPEEFEAALEELGYTEEDKLFLREEYKDANSISGAVGDAFAVEPGRERTDMLPMTKPKGMSAWDALLAGEAKPALPGGVTEGIEGTIDALETPAWAASGLKDQATTENAMKVAGAMGGAGATLPAPEGALRMFGGKKAVDPGFNRSGNPLPETVGFDNNYRFEFSDKEMFAVGQNLSRNSGSLLAATSPKTTTLPDVIGHDELFYQYPHLKDKKVFVDQSLTGTKTDGYFHPANNIIAVSEEVANNPESLRSILLHEIQHDIQQYEGWGGKGTNPEARDVEDRAKSISQERVQRVQELSQQYKQEYKIWRELDRKDSLLKNLDEALPKIIDAGSKLPKNSYYKRELSDLKEDFEYNSRDVRFVDNTSIGLDQFGFKTIDRLAFYATVDKEHRGVNESSEVFKETFGISPEEFNAMERSEKELFAENLGLGVVQPKDPTKNIPSDARVLSVDSWEAYARNSGEVEARNTQSRMELDDVERFNLDPESTEDRPRSVQWYAKGGMVPQNNMENTMNKLFAEGGLNTGDAATDPVSGNEVPPGSMPEEVRDDIDAKLSGGEYVVPADVLRFYGVAFFEKLRKKAKDGLAEMDADGRIGGGGDLAEEDDFPFSEDDLMVADEEDDMEFAEGGAVPFNPNQYMFGGQQIPFGQATTQTNQTAPSGMETKTYVNAQGQTMQVLFINGQPAGEIPPGFTPQGATPAAPTTPAVTPAKPMENKPSGAEDRRNEGMTGREQKGNSATGRTWDPGIDFKDPAAVEKYVSGELSQANRYGQVGSGVGQLLGGPIGGVLAGMGTAGTQVSNARAAAIIARAQGNVELADKLDTQINDYVDSKGLGGKFVLNAIASGEMKAKRFLATQGAATTGDPLTRATAVSAASKNPGTGNSIGVKNKDSNSGGTGPAKTGANKDTKSPSGSVSFSAAKDKPASKPAPSKDKPKSGGNFKGGRATGGLVQRRK